MTLDNIVAKFNKVLSLCYKFVTGAGLRKTDSGGGLIFVNPSDRALYLRGIMVGQSYDSTTSISKFTDISKYVEWLYEIYAMTSKV